jgi:hypothetical protein
MLFPCTVTYSQAGGALPSYTQFCCACISYLVTTRHQGRPQHDRLVCSVTMKKHRKNPTMLHSMEIFDCIYGSKQLGIWSVFTTVCMSARINKMAHEWTSEITSTSYHMLCSFHLPISSCRYTSCMYYPWKNVSIQSLIPSKKP